MKKINFLIVSTAVTLALDLCGLSNLAGQNVGINTDGSVAESGVMFDIKQPTAKATTAAVGTHFQLKSFDADADALKLRLGFKTDAVQASRYGFIDFPDFTASVPTYLSLCLQPSGGKVGIGTTQPSNALSVLTDDATANGSTSVLRISHTTTGTAANGIGSSIIFGAETDNGSDRNIVQIQGLKRCSRCYFYKRSYI